MTNTSLTNHLKRTVTRLPRLNRPMRESSVMITPSQPTDPRLPTKGGLLHASSLPKGRGSKASLLSQRGRERVNLSSRLGYIHRLPRATHLRRGDWDMLHPKASLENRLQIPQITHDAHQSRHLPVAGPKGPHYLKETLRLRPTILKNRKEGRRRSPLMSGRIRRGP